MIITLTAGIQTPAFANSFTVDKVTDTNDAVPGDGDCDDGTAVGPACSLRAAIQEANANGEDDIITVPAGMYALTIDGDDDTAVAGDLDITDDVIEINGAGDGADDASATIIVASALTQPERAVHVVGGTLDLSGVRISGGDVGGGTAPDVNDGGGLLAETTTTLDGVTFAGNTAGRAGGAIEVDLTSGIFSATDVDFSMNDAGVNGGAVHVSNGDTDFANGAVDNNTAAAEGGGFWNNVDATMTVTGTTFTDNTASGADADQGGGSLFNNGGTLVVDGVTSTGGTADGAAGSGGGLLSLDVDDGGDDSTDDDDTMGSAIVTNSTFADGSATRAGGGIELTSGTLDVSDTDFTDNTTGGSPGNGGAIHVSDGDSTISGGTVSGNTAAAEGGGFWNNAGDIMTVTGTTFTDNTASGVAADQGGGSLFNNGGTLVVDGVTSTGGTADGTSGSGGGILADGGTLTVSDSSFDGGSANRAGGGIEATNDASIDLTDTDFDGNSAGDNPGNGGAVHLSGTSTATIVGGEVSSNTAAAEGGGFWNSTASMTVTGTTFTDNTASGDAADQGGGSLFNNGGTLVVDGVTSTGGTADGAAGSGGGLLSLDIDADGTDASAIVTNSTFADGSATRAGGGIELTSGTLDVTDTNFTDNTTGGSPGNGGAIHVSDGDSTISGGTVSGNTAAAEGGGFWNNDDTMTVTGTTFTDNTASGADSTNGGGSLFNDGGTLNVDGITSTGGDAVGTSGSGGGILTDGGTLNVTDSTIADGSANRAGGAIETNGSVTATISGTTLSGNSVGNNPGNGGALHITGDGDVDIDTSTVVDNSAANEGGGLWNSAGGSLDVVNSTVTNNSTDGEGSQVYDDGGGTTLRFTTVNESDSDSAAALDTGAAVENGITLADSIVATSGDDACGSDAIDSDGGNVVTDDTCDLDGSGDQQSADPALQDLADNGGPTQTHALGDDSDALSAAVGDCPDTDQRGADRDSDECDSGSFEGGAPIPPDNDAPDTTITDGPGRGSIQSTVTFRFDSDDDSATFECRITGDTTRRFTDCSSPQSYDLADGDYRFTVRAEDAAGNVDASPAFQDFTIDTEDTFVDDEDSIFETDIEKLHAAGITRGCNPPRNNRFCPDDNVTREQMAAFLNRALDLPEGEEMFDDVDDDNIFADDIGALANSDITRGCNPPDNDEFCPDDFVTREQMAAFLRRGLNLPGAAEMFDDVDADNVFARDIGAIAEADITRGCNPPDNDEFCPDDLVTRGQMAAFLVRAGLT